MTAMKYLNVIWQISLIYGITRLGSWIQSFFHVPLAGSIVGLILFYTLLQLKIVRVTWVKDGANFLLATMVFFFVPSVIGVMDVITEIDMNFVVFFALVVVGTLLVALTSGLVAEKMVMGKVFHKGSHRHI
ncbi:holin [Staphylococcus microti]|uniref:Holin n=1 Tax=Staphylococcus microti TaxID=569857 RepID=A0A0D6XRH0_9STAP|nr:CidA/LrgA family protein [Staphylococcus microti]KIX90413.1 holin [Staphylococcus microti]PNZ84692.1 CidA/LrgA family protein [Staphylococcus microti]SUM58428.1 holin-like protein CidA [Staphylococcus microti]